MYRLLPLAHLLNETPIACHGMGWVQSSVGQELAFTVRAVSLGTCDKKRYTYYKVVGRAYQGRRLMRSTGAAERKVQS